MSKHIRKTSSGQGPAPQMAGASAAAIPERERIEMRAYELYLARGRADGQAVDDWLTAERELSNARRPTRES